jgi:hypothetical protein
MASPKLVQKVPKNESVAYSKHGVRALATNILFEPKHSEYRNLCLVVVSVLVFGAALA